MNINTNLDKPLAIVSTGVNKNKVTLTKSKVDKNKVTLTKGKANRNKITLTKSKTPLTKGPSKTADLGEPLTNGLSKSADLGEPLANGPSKTADLGELLANGPSKSNDFEELLTINKLDNSKILEEMEVNESNNNFCIDNKLFEYQKPHVETIINSIKNNNRALDCSDTGTGKTTCAIATSIKLGLKIFAICPKSVLDTWLQTLKRLKCDYYGITNYESLHNCKYYSKSHMINPLEKKIKKTKCPFVDCKIQKVTAIKKNKEKIKKIFNFTWNIPNDCLVIIDEVHKCKNKSTINSQLLVSLAESTTKILMLSATTCETAEKFLVAGLCLGFYKNLKDGKIWIDTLKGDKMQEINKLVFPNYGSRMKIKLIKDLFPDNTVMADCVEMDCAKEIEIEYKKIEEAINILKNKEDNSGSALSRILYARMRIEQLKIPVFINLVKQYLEDNYSVAIFVNFTGTLLTLAEEFKTNCLIYGEQSLDERNQAINAFKTDKSQIIICNIRSGGVGISLHDENGKHKRVAIISPNYSAQDVLQTLGRIFRAGSKTETLQKIIYCKNTIEESLCEVIKDKIINISNMNDGQRDTYIIKNLLEENDEIINTDDISEFDKLYLKINVLNIKKERLEQDLKIVTDKITELENQIEKHINYD